MSKNKQKKKTSEMTPSIADLILSNEHLTSAANNDNYHRFKEDLKSAQRYRTNNSLRQLYYGPFNEALQSDFLCPALKANAKYLPKEGELVWFEFTHLNAGYEVKQGILIKMMPDNAGFFFDSVIIRQKPSIPQKNIEGGYKVLFLNATNKVEFPEGTHGRPQKSFTPNKPGHQLSPEDEELANKTARLAYAFLVLTCYEKKWRTENNKPLLPSVSENQKDKHLPPVSPSEDYLQRVKRFSGSKEMLEFLGIKPESIRDQIINRKSNLDSSTDLYAKLIRTVAHEAQPLPVDASLYKAAAKIVAAYPTEKLDDLIKMHFSPPTGLWFEAQIPNALTISRTPPKSTESPDKIEHAERTGIAFVKMGEDKYFSTQIIGWRGEGPYASGHFQTMRLDYCALKRENGFSVPTDMDGTKVAPFDHFYRIFAVGLMINQAVVEIDDRSNLGVSASTSSTTLTRQRDIKIHKAPDAKPREKRIDATRSTKTLRFYTVYETSSAQSIKWEEAKRKVYSTLKETLPKDQMNITATETEHLKLTRDNFQIIQNAFTKAAREVLKEAGPDLVAVPVRVAESKRYKHHISGTYTHSPEHIAILLYQERSNNPVADSIWSTARTLYASHEIIGFKIEKGPAQRYGLNTRTDQPPPSSPVIMVNQR